MLCLDVFDHCCVHGTSSFLVGETLTFSRSGERLAWEANNVEVDIWCGSRITLCAIVEECLRLEISFNRGLYVYVCVTAKNVVVWNVQVS